MIWALVAIIALICGAAVDILDKHRKNSAFALALLLSAAIGAGYLWLLLIQAIR